MHSAIQAEAVSRNFALMTSSDLLIATLIWAGSREMELAEFIRLGDAQPALRFRKHGNRDL